MEATLAKSQTPSVIESLTTARRVSGRTRDEVADEAGFAAGSLAAWEKGSSTPKADNLVRWGAALGFEVMAIPAATAAGIREQQAAARALLGA